MPILFVWRFLYLKTYRENCFLLDHISKVFSWQLFATSSVALIDLIAAGVNILIKNMEEKNSKWKNSNSYSIMTKRDLTTRM